MDGIIVKGAPKSIYEIPGTNMFHRGNCDRWIRDYQLEKICNVVKDSKISDWIDFENIDFELAELRAWIYFFMFKVPTKEIRYMIKIGQTDRTLFKEQKHNKGVYTKGGGKGNTGRISCYRNNTNATETFCRNKIIRCLDAGYEVEVYGWRDPNTREIEFPLTGNILTYNAVNQVENEFIKMYRTEFGDRPVGNRMDG
tara:strand:- start:54 stop:647 length:594 start_codon:yes stop_codon:yes gene_type:complete